MARVCKAGFETPIHLGGYHSINDKMSTDTEPVQNENIVLRKKLAQQSAATNTLQSKISYLTSFLERPPPPPPPPEENNNDCAENENVLLKKEVARQQKIIQELELKVTRLTKHLMPTPSTSSAPVPGPRRQVTQPRISPETSNSSEVSQASGSRRGRGRNAGRNRFNWWRNNQRVQAGRGSTSKSTEEKKNDKELHYHFHVSHE